VVAHVVLLAPRPDLAADRRDHVISALERAAREIPSVRRVRIGRRIRHGAAYEQLVTRDFAFAAIFEFDDLAGLQDYLAHPAHADLAARFYDSFSAAVACDYEMDGVAAARGWLGQM
jgi:Stress responsive A/B Barrel Domain